MCCTKAHLIGGMASIALPFLVNFFIYVGRSLVRSYSKMVKRTSTATSSSVISAGPEDRVRKVGVASSDNFQVSHAELFPLFPFVYLYHTPYICMNIYRKRSSTVRAKGCSNLVCGDVGLPKVLTCPKSHPELLDFHTHCWCHGQDNHVCVYCMQNHLLVAHIDIIFQVQNHSAVSLFMVARGEGANVLGESAQGILTICGDYFLFCFQVGEVYCQKVKKNSVGINPQKLQPVSWEIGGSF